MDRQRPQCLRDTGRGVFVAVVSAPALVLGPAQARRQRVSLKALTEAALRILDAVAEILVPGFAGGEPGRYCPGNVPQ